MNLKNEVVRAYLYRVMLAALALLVLYGVISSDDLPFWLEMVAAVLGIAGNGLATLNTKRSLPPPPPPA